MVIDPPRHAKSRPGDIALVVNPERGNFRGIAPRDQPGQFRPGDGAILVAVGICKIIARLLPPGCRCFDNRRPACRHHPRNDARMAIFPIGECCTRERRIMVATADSNQRVGICRGSRRMGFNRKGTMQDVR